MNVCFRKAEADDVRLLTELKREAWRGTYRGIYPDEMLDDFDECGHALTFLNRICTSEADVRVIEADGEPVGYFIVENGKRLYLAALYIAKEEMKRKGIGRLVFDHLRQMAEKNGCASFTCRCSAHNAAALAFYRAMGGTVTETDLGHECRREDQVTFLFFANEARAAEAAAAANTLSGFLGVRDELEHTDIAVLFGGSILAGGDEFASLMRAGIADRTVIVGGEGHTTGALCEKMRAELETYPDGNSEAELFSAYLAAKYGLSVDALETKSTNCGNNITNLLRLIAEKGYPCRSVLFVQDASMQRRMAATMAKYRPDVKVVNHAAYSVRVKAAEGRLEYDSEIRGMWEFGRYFRLLTGEIPRLTDDENGYGPNGKGFIVHVDVPEDVRAAYRTLAALEDDAERKAVQ